MVWRTNSLVAMGLCVIILALGMVLGLTISFQEVSFSVVSRPSTTQLFSAEPSCAPSNLPSDLPTVEPSSFPSTMPSTRPSLAPIMFPDPEPSESIPTNSNSSSSCCCSVHHLEDTVQEPKVLDAQAPIAIITSPFRGKKGACLVLRKKGRNGSYIENIPKLRVLNPDWCYSWGTRPALGVPLLTPNVTDLKGTKIRMDDDGSNETLDYIDYLPMLWGYYPDKIEASLEEIQHQHPRVVLGFNEPDSKKQSNILVDTAVSAWSDIVANLTAKSTNQTSNNTAGDNLLLVSPSCKRPLGPWCRSFFEKIDKANLRVDAIGVHHYGGINDVDFRKKLCKIHEEYGRKPLLLTEFSVADWKATSVGNNRYSPEQVLAFLQKNLPWMESRDWILGYSWFSFDVDDPRGTSSALFANTIFDGNVDWMDSNQTEPAVLELTPLGQFYAQFQSGATKSSRPFPEISSDILPLDRC